MPRIQRKKRSRDIIYLGPQGSLSELGPDTKRCLKAAIGLDPSKGFINAYRIYVGNYKENVKAVSASNAAATGKRLNGLRQHVKGLQMQLKSLSLTDRWVLGRSIPKEYPEDKKIIQVDELQCYLYWFWLLLNSASESLEQEPTRGRMPALAEMALSGALAEILYEETGKMPTVSRDGKYSKLLKQGLFDAGMVKQRRDVVDLMRSGLQQLKEKKDNKTLIPQLPHFEGLPD